MFRKPQLPNHVTAPIGARCYYLWDEDDGPVQASAANCLSLYAFISIGKIRLSGWGTQGIQAFHNAMIPEAGTPWRQVMARFIITMAEKALPQHVYQLAHRVWLVQPKWLPMVRWVQDEAAGDGPVALHVNYRGNPAWANKTKDGLRTVELTAAGNQHLMDYAHGIIGAWPDGTPTPNGPVPLAPDAYLRRKPKRDDDVPAAIPPLALYGIEGNLLCALCQYFWGDITWTIDTLAMLYAKDSIGADGRTELVRRLGLEQTKTGEVSDG